MDLTTLTDRELVELGCALHGGTFGCDPARLNKSAKIAHIQGLADADVVTATAANIVAGRPAGRGNTPAAPKTQPPAPAAAPHSTAAPDVDPASKLAEALRALVGVQSIAPVDETRVRAIALDVARDVTASAPHVEALERLAQHAAERVIEDKANALQLALQKIIDDVEARVNREARPLDLSGVGGAPDVDMTEKHPLFELVLRLVSLPRALRPNVMLVGPAGCGKSTLAHQIADALQRPFAAISLSAGATEAVLTCRVLPVHDGGRFGAVDSEFLRLYAQPSVVLLDEIDGADPNMLLVSNAATANGGMHVEARAVDGQETFVARHDQNVILAAANTYGTGADARYVGRGALDAATLDRYVILEMEYDDALEARIMGVEAPGVARWTPSADTAPDAVRADLAVLHAWIREARAKAQAAGLQRVLSTRMLQKARALRAIGCSVAETKERLLAGWRDDERAAIGWVKEPWDGRVAAGEIANFEDHGHAEGVRCPDCGSGMRLRTAGRGRNAGGKFYGCVNFPRCRGTRDASEAA